MDSKWMVPHGDLVIERIGKRPAGLKLVARDPERGVVLAFGEATGHAHAIASPLASQWEDAEGRRYVLVEGGVAVLDHQEHGPVTLEPGVYQVWQQYEYDPLAERRVSD